MAVSAIVFNRAYPLPEMPAAHSGVAGQAAECVGQSVAGCVPSHKADNRESGHSQSCHVCNHRLEPVGEPENTPNRAMPVRYLLPRGELLRFVEEPLLPRLLGLLAEKERVYREINDLLNEMGVRENQNQGV